MAIPTIRDKDELISHVKDNGSHFFDSDTMRFFRSKLLETIVQKGNLVYFITSEQFVMYYPEYRADPRRYTVRVLDLADKHVNICEIGKFQQYESAKDAKRALMEYLKTVC